VKAILTRVFLSGLKTGGDGTMGGARGTITQVTFSMYWTLGA
jgi:hypothetical protein